MLLRRIKQFEFGNRISILMQFSDVITFTVWCNSDLEFRSGFDLIVVCVCVICQFSIFSKCKISRLVHSSNDYLIKINHHNQQLDILSCYCCSAITLVTRVLGTLCVSNIFTRLGCVRTCFASGSVDSSLD